MFSDFSIYYHIRIDSLREKKHFAFETIGSRTACKFNLKSVFLENVTENKTLQLNATILIFRFVLCTKLKAFASYNDKLYLHFYFIIEREN